MIRVWTLVLCALPLLGLACGDSETPGLGDPNDPEGAATGSGPCNLISSTSHEIVPPAGVKVRFRVQGCDGLPLRPLESGDVSIINDETGEDFNASSEGGGRSLPDVPSDFGFYTVLVLDMSNSIFDNDAVDEVIDGAQVFVDRMVAGQPDNLKQNVALMVFGRTAEINVVMDFTKDAAALSGKLEEMRSSDSLGTTNLYGAYEYALQEVTSAGEDLELVERAVVLLTDGTHEAGDADTLRSQALSSKRSAELNSSVTVFSIGIQGDYDATKLQELATAPEYFLLAKDAAALETTFDEVAERVEAIAKANYVVGVCTPVELGSPSLTIRLMVDGHTDSATIQYSTSELSGDVTSCSSDEVAAAGTQTGSSKPDGEPVEVGEPPSSCAQDCPAPTDDGHVIFACCTSAGRCGFTGLLGPEPTTECVETEQEVDEPCPDGTNGGAPLEGCCQPEGQCGYTIGGSGFGCLLSVAEYNEMNGANVSPTSCVPGGTSDAGGTGGAGGAGGSGGSPEPGTLGGACDVNQDCESGLCTGTGCEYNGGTCGTPPPICVSNVVLHCGCDGVIRQGSSGCPGRRTTNLGFCN